VPSRCTNAHLPSGPHTTLPILAQNTFLCAAGCVEVSVLLTTRQQLRAVAAPLRVDGGLGIAAHPGRRLPLGHFVDLAHDGGVGAWKDWRRGEEGGLEAGLDLREGGATVTPLIPEGDLMVHALQFDDLIKRTAESDSPGGT